VRFVERTSLQTPQDVLKTKKAITQAFMNQIDNAGFSLVEILSPCPTYWGMSPKEALTWIRDVMTKDFPLGRIK